MTSLKYYRFAIALILILGLLAGVTANLAFAQSRRQPPVTNQKKNKRPEPGKEGEKKEEE